MNKLRIATVASLFSAVVVSAVAARAAPGGNASGWQSMSLTDLLWAAKNLAGDDPAVQAARQNIAGHVAARFLTDPAKTRTLSLGQWGEFATHLSGDLTADQRGQWIGKIRAAYVLDAKGLASLKTPADLAALINVLGKLGDKQAAAAAGAFILSTTQWKSWEPVGQIDLARQLSKVGGAGAQARKAVATFMASKYLQAEPSKSLSLSQWKDLIGSLAADLSAEAKAQWATAITKAYVRGAAKALTAKDLTQLMDTLGALGAKDLAVDAVAGLVSDSTAWQNWDLGSQVWLVGVLAAPEQREATVPARLRISEFLTRTHLATVEEAKKVPLRQWADLVMGLYDALPAETRTLWAERLCDMFSSEELTRMGVDSKQRSAMLPAVAILDAKMKTGLALSWLKDRELWQSAPIEALAALAVAANRDSHEAALPLLDELHRYCVARHARQPLTMNECLSLRRVYLSAGLLPRAQQWVWVACDVTVGTEAKRALVDQGTLVTLSIYLNDTDMSGRNRNHPEFAAGVAAVASRGGLDPRVLWQPKCLGESLGTTDMRQIVRDALLDAAGNPRLGAAKILACAYRYDSNEMKAWREHINQEIAASQDQQDRKALWLLVKGYTDSILPDSQNLTHVQAGATAALAQASTDAVRLLAIRELADAYDQTSRPGVAAEIIESIKNQFTGEALATIESMQAGLRKKEASRVAQAQRTKAVAETAHNKAMLKYYEKCLAEATARGDSTEAGKLQAAIRRLSKP